MRLLILILCLLPSVALAVPDIVLVHVYDDVHPSAFGDYRTSTATHPEDAPADWATPNLDAMANAGIRMNNLHVQNVCSQTRAELLGYGPVGQASNPYGRVQSGQTPAQWPMELAPGGAELINAYKEEEYAVAGFGKLHLGREQIKNNLGETFARQMGFDTYEAMIQSNVSAPGACIDLRAFTTNVGWGHNYWCKYNLDGDFEIEGDGTSTVGAANGYTNAIIEAEATAYINAAVADAGSKHLILVFWHAPHNPLNDGDTDGAGANADYDDDGVVDDFQDDRPPGGTSDNDGATDGTPVYGEMLEDLDTRMGNLNDLLDLAAGNANHLALMVADNGVTNAGAGAKCLAAVGRKATPYPCGVGVPAVWDGDDIVGSNVEMNGLFDATDISKTLIHLVNGVQRRPGRTFADCLTGANSRSVTNCPSREFVMSHEYGSTLGGADGADGTAVGENPFPPQDGDSATEWTYDEYGNITDQCGGKKFFLHRQYDTSVATDPTPLCEHFYEITGADPYLEAANVIIQTDCTPGAFIGVVSTAGFDADQACGYAILSREITVRRLRGEFAPVLGSH